MDIVAVLPAVSQLLAAVPPLPLFGVGGGGGSGSGGGGGGDGMSLIFLLGYVPMHALGSWFRRISRRSLVGFGILKIIGWLLSIGYAAVLVWVLGGLGTIAGLGSLVGIAVGLYNLARGLFRSKKAQQALSHASTQDKAWDEQALLARTSDVFARYQKDWSDYDTLSMQTYMTPSYQYHAGLMLYAMRLAARRNLVVDPHIDEAMVTEVIDMTDNAEDQVVVGISFHADDQLIDTRDDTQLFRNKAAFTEYWRFRRHGDGWLLDGIRQATEADWMRNPSLEAFAVSQGYCYSADWGWLLLPREGRLFESGAFGTSDINNHCIGLYEECLVQLYTFNPDPRSGKSYLIAQANVPKAYGRIIVERRKRWGWLTRPSGLHEIATEWPDFNRKYRVYASSAEQATSFELLNPKYMEQLEALPFEVSIEVVDNVVYLYAPQNDRNSDTERYKRMLEVLHAAFLEMRL